MVVVSRVLRGWISSGPAALVAGDQMTTLARILPLVDALIVVGAVVVIVWLSGASWQ